MEKEMDRRFEQAREESNRRFERMEKDMDRRFEQAREESSKRFEAMDKKIDEQGKRTEWLTIQLSPLMGRVGLQFEKIVRGIIERTLDLKEGSVEKLIFVDEKDLKMDIDVYLHNGDQILYDVKSSISRWDVYDFIRKADYAQSRLKKQMRKIVVCFTISKAAKEVCGQFDIEVISPEKDKVKFIKEQ